MSGAAPAYTDYLFTAPSLVDIETALADLQSAGLLGTGDVPMNMLGDLVTLPGGAVIRSRQDANGVWYLAIRTKIPPQEVPFDPATVGLVACSDADSAAVLGKWAA